MFVYMHTCVCLCVVVWWGDIQFMVDVKQTLRLTFRHYYKFLTFMAEYEFIPKEKTKGQAVKQQCQVQTSKCDALHFYFILNKTNASE